MEVSKQVLQQLSWCLGYQLTIFYYMMRTRLFQQVEKLHSLLRPHLLRRLKRDVLRTLPPKKEQMVRVELSPLQKDYYRAILTKSYPVLTAGGELLPQPPCKL